MFLIKYQITIRLEEWLLKTPLLYITLRLFYKN